MAIWYMNLEQEEKMIEFDEIIHTYMKDKRKAEVGIIRGVYGLRMWENQVWMKDELFKGHSEQYAEDAADNYVFGIKN